MDSEMDINGGGISENALSDEVRYSIAAFLCLIKRAFRASDFEEIEKQLKLKEESYKKEKFALEARVERISRLGSEELHKKEEQLKGVMIKNEEIMNQGLELKQKYEDLNKENDELRKKKEQLKDVKKQKLTLEAKVERISRLGSEELHKKKEQLKRVMIKNEEIMNQGLELRKKYEDLKKENDELRKKDEQLKDVMKENEEMRNDKEELKKTCENLIRKNKLMEADLGEEHEAKEKVERLVEELRETERGCRAKCIELEARYSQLNFGKLITENELENCKRRCSELEERLSVKEEDYRAISDREQLLKDRISGLMEIWKDFSPPETQKNMELGSSKTRDSAQNPTHERADKARKRTKTKQVRSADINLFDNLPCYSRLPCMARVSVGRFNAGEPSITGVSNDGFKDVGEQVSSPECAGSGRNGLITPSNCSNLGNVKSTKPVKEGPIQISDSDSETSGGAEAACIEETYPREPHKSGRETPNSVCGNSSTEEDFVFVHNEKRIGQSFTPKRGRRTRVVRESDSEDDADALVSYFEVRNSEENVINMGGEEEGSDYGSGCKSLGGLAINGSDNEKRMGSTVRNEKRIGQSFTPKRGRQTRVIRESNSEDDADALVSRFKVRKLEENVINMGAAEEGPDRGSEGESLGGFIVNGSDTSNSSADNGEGSGSSYHKEFNEILASMSSKHSLKWDFEADMLAAFAKNPELCMKAVCALYRQQTSDEQSTKFSLHANSRGFNKFDAYKGSHIAEFLTEGDAYGPLKKSAKELENYDHGAVDYCSKLASHYSKQLFKIYQSGEDPLFGPS
ncbi:uncharacterized protein LOC18429854 [Amborella trichopoda]|uniref:Uncharacterized protein n=1 Tax=Amborella trichopoda TaxID=13333 RepID=W1P2G9_AMBTC|nr:uncharacterized protein LOC18429854 [Amborella trichopoda]ERN01761.1 hypothetical protein AMTR_s00097p00145190 [Amborella trichopoda]|eukprot:XP_006839192.3 uncharacterized protein LOC18429854 [Amborella trichopoda]